MRFPQNPFRTGTRGFRRPVCALLALLLLLLSFALPSCGKDPGSDGAEDSPDTSSEAGTSGSPVDLPSEDGPDGNHSALVYRAPEKTLAALPDYTPDGALIIAADSRCGGILGEHTLLGSSYDGVNAAIRERFGAEAYFQSYSSGELFSKTQAAAAGTGDGESFFADLLAIPLSSLPEYLAADLLMPLSELPGFSFLTPDAASDGTAGRDGILLSCARELAVNGQCYALPGSGTLSELGGVCLLFNHTLLDALLKDRSDLYAEVKNGNFTWERLRVLLRAADEALSPAQEGGASGEGAGTSQTAPGIPGYEGETLSLIGTTLSDEAFKAAIYRSCGGSLSGAAAAGSYDPDALAALAALSSYGPLRGDAADAAFREGNLLFLVTTVDALYDYPNSDGSWGCLPLPKKNGETQGYTALLDPDSTTVLVVPKGSLRLETKSGYLTALNAAAHYACLPAFAYELLSGFIREGDSMEMLPYLLGSTVAEPTFLLPHKADVFAGLDAAVASFAASPSGGAAPSGAAAE